MPPEPAALMGVLAAGALYARGVLTLWQRAGREHVVRRWQAACFGGGLLAIVVALESPLDTLSQDLFAVHMVQHLLLILVAGPLLVLGAPLPPLLWALPEASRRTLGSWWRTIALLARPAVAFGAHSLALWLWHLPALYDAALRSRGIHVLEHLSFLATAALFWWAVLHTAHRSQGLGILYFFAMALQSTVLGALLTFSQMPWYTAHLASAPAWGLTPLEDQQFAGLIMWVPGGGVYLAAALGLFATWFRVSSKASASSS
jgi:putative membrane protein